MLLGITQVQFLTELSNQEQELINGGIQPQTSNNNFTQKNANQTQTNNSDRFGNISQSKTDFLDVNSSSQSVLSSDVIGDKQSNGINTFTVLPPVAMNSN